jgi:hypothetical protein
MARVAGVSGLAIIPVLSGPPAILLQCGTHGRIAGGTATIDVKSLCRVLLAVLLAVNG